MFNRFKSLAIVACTAGVLFSTPSYAKDVFKSSEFLTWDRDAQEFYIDTTVGMAGLISARNVESHADCLEDWYFSKQEERNNFILEKMREHSEFHPRGVILAVLEKQCGSFTYTK